MTTQTVDQEANGRTVAAAAGDIIVVELPENPTTGYRWTPVTTGAPVLVVVDDSFRPPGEAVPGRGGTHVWTFRVEQTGDAVIELAARRAWEQDAPAASSFRVTVSAGR